MAKLQVEIEGQRIKSVRKMTAAEMSSEGWALTIHGAPTVLVLENGTILYPSRDPEGNGAGCLYGKFKGKTFYA